MVSDELFQALTDTGNFFKNVSVTVSTCKVYRWHFELQTTFLKNTSVTASDCLDNIESYKTSDFLKKVTCDCQYL